MRHTCEVAATVAVLPAKNPPLLPCAELLLVERCVEEENFWHAVLRRNTGKKPNGLDLSLDCVVREDPPNNVWWWVNGTKLDLAHHRGWLTFTSNKE